MAQTTPVHSGYTIINGTSTGSNASKINTWIEYKVISQDTTNNKSYMDVYLYARANTSGLSTSWQHNNTYGSITVNGTTYSGPALTNGYDFRSTSIYNLMSYRTSIEIPHNSDGTKTVSIAGSWDKGTSTSTYITGGNVPATSVTLPSIPRASTFTVASGTKYFGMAFSITLNRASSAFYHKVFYSFGSISDAQIASGQNITSVTIPTSAAAQIPAATSGTVTLKLVTYTDSSYNTAIGSKTTTLTVNIPTSWAVSIGSITLAEANTDVVPSSWGVYVKGKSKVKVTLNNVSATSGSTISSYAINAASQSGSSNPFTTGIINSSGTLSVSAKATDRRGKSATKTASFTVYDYSSPSISNVSVYRCNSSGTANSEGTYCYIKATRTYSSCNNKNTVTFQYRTRVVGGTWSSYATLTSGTAVIKSNFATTNAYEVEIKVADYFTSVTTTKTVAKSPSSARILNIHSSGNGLSIGALSTAAGYFEESYPAKFYDDVYLTSGLPLQSDNSNLPILTGGSYTGSLNNITKSGYFWCNMKDGYTTDAPVTTGYGVILCYQFGAEGWVQQFVQYSSCRTWMRMYINGQWYPWSEISSNRGTVSLCSQGNYYTVGTKITLNQPYTNFRKLIFRLGLNESAGGSSFQELSSSFISTSSSSIMYYGMNWYDGAVINNIAFKFNSATVVEITGKSGSSNYGIRTIYGSN